jgi:hypothetical protein
MEIKFENGEIKTLESLNLEETKSVLEFYVSKAATLLGGMIMDTFFAAILVIVLVLGLSRYPIPDILNLIASIVIILLVWFICCRGILRAVRAFRVAIIMNSLKKRRVQIGTTKPNSAKS